jgi:RepB DNA-primase from phage plasmid
LAAKRQTDPEVAAVAAARKSQPGPYLRAACGLHGLSLVDDLNAAAIVRMKAQEFAPAAVVETSPGNFQAWLRHGQVMDEATSTRAAKLLAERFGGDLGSADWRHFVSV